MANDLLQLFKTGLLCIALLALAACKKDPADDGSHKKTEKQLQEELLKDARYNEVIISGAGNFLIQERLTPTNNAAHFATLALKQDSVFFLGTTDSDGRAEEISSITIQFEDGNLFVTEYRDQATEAISYRVNNGVRSNIVLRTTSYGVRNIEYAILDYDWSNHTLKVLASVLYEGERIIANSMLMGPQPPPTLAMLSSVQAQTNDSPPSSTCKTPPPAQADELNKKLYEDMQFIACNGTHPINGPFIFLKEKLDALVDAIEQSEIGQTITENERLSEIFVDLADRLDKLKARGRALRSKIGENILELISKYGTGGRPYVKLYLDEEHIRL